MKRQAYMCIALLVLIGSMALSASAQTTSRTELRADIPFQFNVGSQTLPAGQYRLLSVSTDSPTVIFKFESEDRRSFMLQMRTLEGNAQDGAKLIFHRYGNRYYFAEAWLNRAQGWRAPKSRSERSTELETAALDAKIESVALKAQR